MPIGFIFVCSLPIGYCKMEVGVDYTLGHIQDMNDVV